jgi:hypothetical protein
MDFGNIATLIATVFVASAALTAVARSVARRRGWLAHPRPERWRRESTALFGGVGIYLAFVGGVVAVLPLTQHERACGVHCARPVRHAACSCGRRMRRSVAGRHREVHNRPDCQFKTRRRPVQTRPPLQLG